MIAEAHVGIDKAMDDLAALDGDCRAEYREQPPDLYVRCSNSAALAAALHKEALARGDVARAAIADRWFAEAVCQAPDLLITYFEWGQALLARGEPARLSSSGRQ